MAKREFTHTVFAKIDFVWRIALFLILSLSYLLGVYLIGTTHFTVLSNFENVSNEAMRIDSHLSRTANGMQY
ncbi:MAG: hypothetical protein P4M11_03615 [Candidatus Pacebacteria bacterium]|nr:hypothetical protein [Candidatus Paceibacterota bacterium]